MSDLRLRIEHSDGTESELAIVKPDDVGDAPAASLQSLSIERAIGRNPDECDRAECRVYRDAWRSLDIDPIDDRFIIVDRSADVDIFGGRLKDVEQSGTTVNVLLDGPKRDALDAEPSAGNELYPVQSDAALVENELLARVPTVDAGVVEQNAAIAFSESQASPGASVTKLAEAAGAEVVYRPDWTVDYVPRLGEDRADETLSPSAATVFGDARVRESATEDITHVRVLGAQEGTAQVVAESPVDESTDRRVYRDRTDKDIQRQSRAQALADELAAEYQDAPEFVDVELSVEPAVDPSLGDSFHVELPSHDIDETLRIMTLERILDTAGERFRCLLSNRKLSRDTATDAQQRSVDEFRGGNAGQIVRDSDSQGFDKVDDGEPMAFDFRYPDDVIDEYEAVLRVESRPFRRPASAQGHSHAFSIDSHSHGVSISDTTTSEDNADYELSTTVGIDSGLSTPVDDEWTTLQTVDIDVGDDGSELRYIGVIRNTDDETTELDARLYDADAGEEFSETHLGPLESFDTRFYTGAIPRNMAGRTAKLQVRQFGLGDLGEFDVATFGRFEQIGRHTHEVTISDFTTTASGGGVSSTTDSETSLEPGIVTEADLTPSDVAVAIDGETVASGLDHPIDETVDISGVLDAGPNTVEATTASLGELRLSVTFEALKNTGGS